MGIELKRDVCPQKYYEKGSIMKDTLSTAECMLAVKRL